MRRAAVLLLASLAVPACGGEPPPPVAPVVSVPAPTTPPPPLPPPLPPEPAGLALVAAPGDKVCELAGTLGGDGLELAAPTGGGAFGEVSHVPVTLSFSEGGAAFVEARAPSWTLRGAAPRESARVHATRWLAFGGVYYAGAGDRLRVDAAHGGKVVLAAPDLSGFTLADSARVLEAPCDALSVDPDPAGVLRQGLPPAFATDKKEQTMLLSRRKPVAVSADPGGPAGGTIDSSPRPARVTVLERRGARARIRWGHLAGWVDASLLAPPKPPPSKRLAILEAAQFGMIGLLSSAGSAPARETPASSSDAGSAVVCAADVRILANVTGSADAPLTRYIVGAIPAGKPVRVIDRGPEIAHLAVSDGSFVPGAVRLAVPARDVAAGCSPAPDAPIPAGSGRVATADAPPPEDAVDQLGGEGPEAAPDSPFGMGGLGLSGVGEGAGGRGEGIGLGSIGTIGHGAGTGTGQGFSRGSGSLSGDHSVAAPSLREGAVSVNGRLPPEVIRRIARQNFGRFRLCYENGLRAKPGLTGRVTVTFSIDRTGAVASATNGGSDLPSADVIACVVRGFSQLSFPQPEGGTVTVTYPILFSPGQPSTAKP